MVCTKCEKKLTAVVTPEPWKDGSKNSSTGSSGRKINENKLLSSKNKNKFAPYERTCKTCKSRVSQTGAQYCQGCSYKAGKLKVASFDSLFSFVSESASLNFSLFLLTYHITGLPWQVSVQCAASRFWIQVAISSPPSRASGLQYCSQSNRSHVSHRLSNTSMVNSDIISNSIHK
jgi:hypothetical protein